MPFYGIYKRFSISLLWLFCAIINGFMHTHLFSHRLVRRVLCLVAIALAFTISRNVSAQATQPLVTARGTTIFLMQPFNGVTSLSTGSGGIDVFFNYFNSFWPWLLGVAGGICVLWGVVGGVMMMWGGSGSSEGYSSGKQHIIWAMAGLIILSLSGFILKMISPLFYV